MCRFVAYLGHQEKRLGELLLEPNNSLIKQSRFAREELDRTNADGFGLGWYDRLYDRTPGIFRSVQPAWNDENLIHIANRIVSKCFIGHVRASRTSSVCLMNCHPFANDDLMFAHNGLIRSIDSVLRLIYNELDDEHMHAIKGHTDSEYFFALWMNHWRRGNGKFNFNDLNDSFIWTMKFIQDGKRKARATMKSTMNCVLTNGSHLFAVRYDSEQDDATHTLHLCENPNKHGGVIVSSEMLEEDTAWQPIPVHSALFVDENLSVKKGPLPASL